LISMLEPESIPVFEIVELNSNDTSESRANCCARQWIFGQTSGK